MDIRNNYSSPNFGMAMIVKAKPEKLKELPLEVIQSLQKAGKELIDTKFFNVEVAEDLSCNVSSTKNAYFGLKIPGANTRRGRAENVVMINNNYGVARYPNTYVDPEKPFYSIWQFRTLNSVNDIESIAKVTKLLDDAAVAHYNETQIGLAAEAAEALKKSQAVESLLSVYGK